MITASEIKEALLNGPKVPLHKMPVSQGIYALADHTGAVRYVGCTEQGMLSRVNHYHVTGTRNSHKYSCAYNSGVMYHDRRDPLSLKAGPVAKKLRTMFIRAKCTAIGFVLPDITFGALKGLESEVIDLMPPQAVAWNNRTVIDPFKPESIATEVEAFMDELEWPWEKIQAVRTQAALYESIRQREPSA